MACGKYIKARYVGDDLDDSIGMTVEYIADTEASVEKRGFVFGDGRELNIDQWPELWKVYGHTYTRECTTPTRAGFFRIPDLRAQKPTCYHRWEKYNGFTEVYDYCVYCDEKRR